MKSGAPATVPFLREYVMHLEDTERLRGCQVGFDDEASRVIKHL